MALRQALTTSKNPLKKTLYTQQIRRVNNVPEKIKLFNAKPHLHGADNPTWLKGNTDTISAFTGFGLCAFGLLQGIRGMVNMGMGVGKDD